MVARCKAASQVKGKLLASRTPQFPAPLLHVEAPFVLHHHGAWTHTKYFYSYGRLKDAHSSCIMSSLLPREVSEKVGNLHQLQTYPQISLMLEAGNDCACGQQRNGGEEAAKNNWWVDAFKEIQAWLKAISWSINKFFQELQRRRYVHDEPRKEGKENKYIHMSLLKPLTRAKKSFQGTLGFFVTFHRAASATPNCDGN